MMQHLPAAVLSATCLPPSRSPMTMQSATLDAAYASSCFSMTSQLAQPVIQADWPAASAACTHNTETLPWMCRMLLEASPQLNSLPQQWLHHLLAHMQRPGQSRDDIVRRSAGLPAAFVAVFAAEPTGHPKTLLQHGRPYPDLGSPPYR